MVKKNRAKTVVNNAFYDDLGEDWHKSDSHPVSLLRAENRIRIPWVLEKVEAHFKKSIKVLDLGCGGGFLTHAFAKEGHETFGIDLSEKSLEVARLYDSTGKVQYEKGNALATSYADGSFDVVCAMDLLEHVEEPNRVIQEAGRLLKKKGLFFFHTFNRTLLSYILVIKGVDWFVPNSPKNMHLLRLFIKPEELNQMCLSQELKVIEMEGFAPKIWQKPVLKLLKERKISEDFHFKFTKSLRTGYVGFSLKG